MARTIIAGFLLAFMGLGLFAGGTARAQDGVELPITPGAELCVITPLTPEEVAAAANATPVIEPAVQATPGGAFTMPEGTPADEETVQAIAELVTQAVACINAGNYLAFFAFFSDSYIAEQLGGGDISVEAIEAIAATPVSTEGIVQATLVDVRDIVVLPDGTAGALVDTIFPDQQPGVQTDYFTFVEQDGVWRIAGIVEDLEDQYPPVATPAA